MNIKQFVVPITKVDEVQRLVYGQMCSEALDKSGESLDYDASKTYFMSWSDEINKASFGKSFGNVREMHGKTAAGKLVEALGFDDENKIINICAKVIDDDAWEKVDEGIYTGFSIGGRYVGTSKVVAGVKKYTLNPFEVSLVDNPCIPGANFEVVKADGMTEHRAFKSIITEKTPVAPTNDEIADKARELCKVAGAEEKKWPDYVEEARKTLEAAGADEATVDPAAEVEGAKEASKAAEEPVIALAVAFPEPRDVVKQVWSTPDGSIFEKKAEAVSHVQKMAAEKSPLDAALDKLRTAASKATKQPAEKVSTGLVNKSMSSISHLACILMELQWLQMCLQDEAEWEGDGSTVPAMLTEQTAALVETLKALVDEETSEMLTSMGNPDMDSIIIEMSAGKQDRHIVEKFTQYLETTSEKFSGIAEKVGKRNSQADQDKLQAMHDHSVSLGAACPQPEADKAADAVVEKVSEGVVKLDGEVAEKMAALEKQNTELGETVAKAIGVIGELTTKFEEMSKRSAMPVAHKTEVRVVEKEADGMSARAEEVLKNASPELLATAAIKLVQSAGGQRFNMGGPR